MRTGLTRFSFFCWCALSGLPSAAFYGVDYDPGQPAASRESLVFPLNGNMFRLRQPDGVVRDFVRDAEEPNYLVGDTPWVGQIEGSRITIMTHPDFKGGRTGFLFDHGRLQLLLLDGKEVKAGKTTRPFVDSVESLWPAARPTEEELKSEKYDIWVHSASDGRMRFGFSNPNKAGAFFVGIAFLGLSLCFFRSRIWLCPGLLLFAASAACLVMTQSRGGLVALAAGLSVVGLSRIRAFLSWRRLAVLAALLAAFVGFVLLSGTAERFGRNFLKEGESETSRIPIWQAAPRMMVDAPGGWGLGNSGVAYINWYQPQNRFHVVRALLNSHLTWLVETGWSVRFAYVFGWLLIVGCLIRKALSGGNPAAPAAWVGLGVAACFNHVAESLLVWCVPAVFLSGFLMTRPWRCCRLYRWPVILSLAGAVLFVGGLFAFGRMTTGEGLEICGSADCVVVNGEAATNWIVDDDFVLHGGYWGMNGKQVRRYYKKHPNSPALGYVRSIDALPASIERLVLAGKSGPAFLTRWEKDPASVCRAKKVIFLSPPFSATAVPEKFRKAVETEVVQGEFLAGLFPPVGSACPGANILPGLEVFVPGWIRLALGE